MFVCAKGVGILNVLLVTKIIKLWCAVLQLQCGHVALVALH